MAHKSGLQGRRRAKSESPAELPAESVPAPDAKTESKASPPPTPDGEIKGFDRLLSWEEVQFHDPNYIDNFVGTRVGTMEVTGFADAVPGKRGTYDSWHVKCHACGAHKVKTGNNLRLGQQSCGRDCSAYRKNRSKSKNKNKKR